MHTETAPAPQQSLWHVRGARRFSDARSASCCEEALRGQHRELVLGGHGRFLPGPPLLMGAEVKIGRAASGQAHSFHH